MTVKKHNLKRRVERKHEKGENFPRLYNDDDDIEDLGCSYGQACNWLKKSWLKLRICRSKGDEIGTDEAQDSINRIQSAIGIPITEWENYDG